MSVHLQKYLYEADLCNPFRPPLMEMSANAAVENAEAGLEPEKKKRIKGLLPTGEYKALKFEKLEGPHGEPEYETCENCKKSIRYVVTVSGPDDTHIVGPDCAIALTTGETQAAILEYVTNEKKKLKFLKQSMEKIKEFCDFYGNTDAARYKFSNPNAKDPGDMWQKETVWTIFDAAQKSGFSTFGSMSKFCGSKQVWSFLDTFNRAQKDTVVNMQYILNALAYQRLIDKFGDVLLSALEKALSENKTLKNKNFFFEPNYGYVDFIKDYGLAEIIDHEKI